MLNNTVELTGTQLNYYFVCKRKLWLHSRNISFESSSELVKLGNLIHKDSYKRKKKEIRIGSISVDYINKGEIHEVKKIRQNTRCTHISNIVLYSLSEKTWH